MLNVSGENNLSRFSRTRASTNLNLFYIVKRDPSQFLQGKFFWGYLPIQTFRLHQFYLFLFGNLRRQALIDAPS